MGGWHRLFVVFSAVVFLAFVLFYVEKRPNEYTAGEYVGLHCGQYNWVSPAQAKRWLQDGRIIDPDYQDDPNREGLVPRCRTDLEDYLSGARLKRDRDSYDSQLPTAIGGVVFLLALVYGIGWVIGWVWRGFRRKPEA